MKINLETTVKRVAAQGQGSPWWARKFAIPVVAIIALIAVPMVTLVVVILLLNHQTYSGPQAPPSATFLKADSTTQGAWKGDYGFAGYAIANERPALPPFVRVGIPDKTHDSFWVDQIDDARALQKPSGAKRIASAWYGWKELQIDVNLLDGKTHSVALYLLDYDSDTRAEGIEILNGINHKVLDARPVSKFHDGQYMVWRMSGHVIIQATHVTGANAVVSGLFID